jgi:predicted SprT family Zn-dependent metalloprotease
VCTPQPDAQSPTTQVYTSLQAAYDFFNAKLFQGRLPHCLITLQRQRRALGYFSGGRFAALKGDERTDEIALNPQHFRERTPEDTASTLAHEMVHLAQYHFGKPTKPGYHDRQWAKAMKAIGLYPSSTGEPGGKETGYHMDDYIVAGGPFAMAYAEFERTGATIGWGDAVNRSKDGSAPKQKRVKLVCPNCSANVHATRAVRVACIPCGMEMVA